MKRNGPFLGAVAMLAVLAMQAVAFLLGNENTLTFSAMMISSGGALAACTHRIAAGIPLFKGVPLREMLKEAGTGLANAVSIFGLAPAVAMIGIGPAMTIFALGSLLTSRSHPGWRAMAVIGVGVVDRFWVIAEGNNQAVGLALAATAALSQWFYVRAVFRYEEGETERDEATTSPRFLGAIMGWTALWAAGIGVLGLALGYGVVPAWPQLPTMLLAGVLMFGIPGILLYPASQMVPKKVAGFILSLDTAVGAIVGEGAALLGHPEQAPTLLGWTGVAIVVTATAAVMRNDKRRREPSAAEPVARK